MVYFPGTEYRTHTSCMTEEQKYQGALYKAKKQKSTHPEPQTTATSELESKKMSQRAYVEDVTEEYEAYREFEINSDDDDSKSTADLPPEAPTPPSAVEANVNVFDFLVAATPNASNLNLPPSNEAETGDSTELVRYDQDANSYVDPSGYMVDDEDMIHYGTGPLPPHVHFETPAPKGERRKTKDPEREQKKDKKRKRLHIETNSPLAIDNGPGDQEMTDAPPPELHSGLTGGLNRLMRPSVFPPSPDYSGGDGGENSPASPIKKSKHHKHPKPSRTETFGNNLKALMSGTSKTTTKVSKKRKHSTERKEKKKRHHHRSDDEKAPKLIEYRPQSADGKEGDGQIVVFKPRSELFLGMCTKGPDSDRGYSMNKALKRFHRERTSSGSNLGKVMEEKELWRSLRMRRNDRGEIVLFSV
ncbi:LYAR-type C2HC zinc finger protein [Xylariales sp. AK1849]|nr:LYAR-type C2HC zinc finger protein [Xylariales sp. AK1849]